MSEPILRVSENPDDGTSVWGARVLVHQGIETGVRAMFVEAKEAHEYVRLEAENTRLREALEALDALYDGKPEGFRRQLDSEDFGDVLDHALPEFRAAYALAANVLEEQG